MNEFERRTLELLPEGLDANTVAELRSFARALDFFMEFSSSHSIEVFGNDVECIPRKGFAGSGKAQTNGVTPLQAVLLAAEELRRVADLRREEWERKRNAADMLYHALRGVCRAENKDGPCWCGTDKIGTHTYECDKARRAIAEASLPQQEERP